MQRHRGDDDDVVALQQRPRRRVAHAVDLLVDRAVLLDVGVGARDVGLGLVVVVVGDEVLDRVVREEALELAVELGGQGLVGRQDQRRALRRLDHLGHGEGLARAGDAEQHLVALVRRRRPRPARRSPSAGRPRARSRDTSLKRLPALGLLRPRRPVRHEHRHARRRRAGARPSSAGVCSISRAPSERSAGLASSASRYAPRWPRRPSAGRGPCWRSAGSVGRAGPVSDPPGLTPSSRGALPSGFSPEWSPRGVRPRGSDTLAVAVSNPVCGASAKPVSLAARAFSARPARTSGVPAAVSRGGADGLPDLPREARGFGVLSGSLGVRGMPRIWRAPRPGSRHPGARAVRSSL